MTSTKAVEFVDIVEEKTFNSIDRFALNSTTFAPRNDSLVIAQQNAFFFGKKKSHNLQIFR